MSRYIRLIGFGLCVGDAGIDYYRNNFKQIMYASGPSMLPTLPEEVTRLEANNIVLTSKMPKLGIMQL